MTTAILALLLAFQSGLEEVELTDDLVVTENVAIKPGVYRIKDQGKPGVLHVEGEHVLVILHGVTLIGADEDQEPDSFAGTGVVVKGSGNVVHGGKVKGFKVGVHVAGGEGHYLMSMDVGGNFAQRLKSTREAEDEKDWLWPHENDEGQWAKKYGAGIWVEGAKEVGILGCKGHGSQNGVILDRTNGSMVRDCDFSYNSGWGLALWRSSDNEVVDNVLDWCVRGYSHGVYARGQDSAGILVFEQCHRNVFRDNSATHSGDGFFLYAGHETTRKTGEGGCNDNRVEGNDFSHAVANGIEATFSTGNVFVRNRLDDCNYGIWAGYSRKSVFERNLIRGCTYAGIAIEHGSDNEIRGNLGDGCPKGVWLWWDEDKEFMWDDDEDKDLKSVYGKENRTDSADTLVTGNVIRGGQAGVHLRDSARIRILKNWIEGSSEEVARVGECPDVEVLPAQSPPKLDVEVPRDGLDARRGRRFILVDEWGPYDFLTPRLSPARVESRPTAIFMILGAEEPISIKKVEGDVDVILRRGHDVYPLLEAIAKPKAGSYVPFSFVVESGGASLSGSGILLRTDWQVRFWKWETDPREGDEAWKALLATEPFLSRSLPALDFRWSSGGPGGGAVRDRFATVAETSLALPAGRYEITTVSDDGVRVSVDGARVIDNWTHHAPTEDRGTVEVRADPETGKAKPVAVRVEHFEIDGASALSFRIRRVE
jgi:parallel beta-helix repeat protein